MYRIQIQRDRIKEWLNRVVERNAQAEGKLLENVTILMDGLQQLETSPKNHPNLWCANSISLH